MNFSDFFRSFVGLNRQNPSNNNGGVHGEFRNPIWNIDDDDDTDDELHHGFGRQNNMFPGDSFNVFTDPLEMARFAEHQMERMMGLFSSMMDQQYGNKFTLPPNMHTPGSAIPAIKEKGEGSIRDEYLKPGYLKPSTPNKVDSDLDNKISSDNLNSLLDNIGKLQIDKPQTYLDKNIQENDTPRTSNNNIFFRQVITRSITRPDGSVKTTTTVRNGDGTEETTSIITQGSDTRGYDPAVTSYRDFWSSFFGL